MIFTIDNISKRYSENVVLDDISMTIESGRIYGLIGYNGGGKSTLGQIITGVIPPDSGRLLLDEAELGNWNVKKAMQSGIFLIDQNSTVLSDLTIEENLFLGINFIKRNPLHNSLYYLSKFKKRYKELFAKYHIKNDPKILMGKIPRADQMILELIRIQMCNPKLIVIDEIDTNMDGSSQILIDIIMKDIAAEGTSIIYISHNLEHVLNISNKISVIVETKLIDTMDSTNTDTASVVDMMLKVSKEKPPRIIIEPQACILEMDHISTTTIKDFNAEVCEGQIVGIFGLDREGDGSFAKLLFAKKGKKRFREKEVHISTPQETIDMGVVFLDSNIMQNYLFVGSSILENMMPFRIRSAKLSIQIQEEMCRRYLKQLSIKAEPDYKIEELSTGDQKKVLIVRNILSEGEVFIFDRLMDNIDVISKVDIFNIINQLKRNGKGIILISNNIKELSGISDVVYVVKNGKMIYKGTNIQKNEKELFDKCMC